MKRMPQTRCHLECLEDRRFLTLTMAPSAADQYFIELINRARLNPLGEAARYNWGLNEGLPAGAISSAPKQPLALNPILVYTAEGQSKYVLQSQIGSHSGPGGSSPADRMRAAGYNFFSWTNKASENIAWPSATGNLEKDVESIHRGLFIDTYDAERGHRLNIMDPVLKEVGTGVQEGMFAGYFAAVGTMDAAVTGDSGSILTGVAYIDAVVRNNFYDIGEGLGGVVVKAVRSSDGAVFQTTTFGSGGYSIKLSPGTYAVSATGSGLGGTISVGNITMGADNRKIDFKPGSGAPVSPPPPASPPPVTTTQSPYGAVPNISPTAAAVIQAENFDNGGEGVSYHDTDAANLGGQYRSSAVDIATINDGGAGYGLTFVRAGEWLEYTVNVATAGTYRFDFRVASQGNGGQFHASFDENGALVNKTGTLSIPNTGSWGAWQSVSKGGVNLTAGKHILRLSFDSDGTSGFTGNLNSFTIRTDSVTPPAGQQVTTAPFSGTPLAIASSGPTFLEAEKFDIGADGAAYHDSDTVNQGGLFRTTGVDIGSANDIGGGYAVGWTKAGEYLTYTVNVAASGNYNVGFRVAAAGQGGTFHLEVDGVNKTGAMTISNTGGWQTWKMLTKYGVSLSTGKHVVKVVFDSVGQYGFTGSLNWVSFQKT